MHQLKFRTKHLVLHIWGHLSITILISEFLQYRTKLIACWEDGETTYTPLLYMAKIVIWFYPYYLFCLRRSRSVSCLWGRQPSCDSQIYYNKTRLQCAHYACALSMWLTHLFHDNRWQSVFIYARSIKVLSVKASSPASLFAVEAHEWARARDWPRYM